RPGPPDRRQGGVGGARRTSVRGVVDLRGGGLPAAWLRLPPPCRPAADLADAPGGKPQRRLATGARRRRRSRGSPVLRALPRPLRRQRRRYGRGRPRPLAPRPRRRPHADLLAADAIGLGAQIVKRAPVTLTR